MKKRLLFIAIPLLFALGVFFTFTLFLQQSGGKGALQVTASPKSKVYINGTYIGSTPLCKCEGSDTLAVGEYTIKVDPETAPYTAFEEKITISRGILTVVDRTFGKGVTSEGSIISLTPLENPKAVELLVLSFPENAQVSVDSSPAGSTPLLLKDLTESDHQVTIKKNGYREKTVRIKTIAGYKLTIILSLGVAVGNLSLTPSPSPVASPSAVISQSKVTILETPTGFLRVRSASNAASLEVGRVNPGDSYLLLEENDSWYYIQLGTGEKGWISKQYAKPS